MDASTETIYNKCRSKSYDNKTETIFGNVRLNASRVLPGNETLIRPRREILNEPETYQLITAEAPKLPCNNKKFIDYVYIDPTLTLRSFLTFLSHLCQSPPHRLLCQLRRNFCRLTFSVLVGGTFREIKAPIYDELTQLGHIGNSIPEPSDPQISEPRQRRSYLQHHLRLAERLDEYRQA